MQCSVVNLIHCFRTAEEKLDQEMKWDNRKAEADVKKTN